MFLFAAFTKLVLLDYHFIAVFIRVLRWGPFLVVLRRVLRFGGGFIRGEKCRGCVAGGCPSGGVTVLSYVSAHLARLLPTTLKVRGKSMGVVGGTNTIVSRPFNDIVHDLLITVVRLKMRRIVIVTRSSYNTYRVGDSRVVTRVGGQKVGSRAVSVVHCYKISFGS